MTQPRTALQVVTRFAPSPTGYMHLGHAYAAIFAWNAARERNGRFLLRIEDIDQDRCRPLRSIRLPAPTSWSRTAQTP